MKRTISKRVDLNETEAKILRMKSEQCGLSEADYLRELLMNSQPVEAPPRQFYERMAMLNQIVSWIQDILLRAENTIPAETMDSLKNIYSQLVDQIVAIKEIVSKARFFTPDVYERWEHDVETAKKAGRTPPAFEEYCSELERRMIRDPATDMSLGWNALGIQPPFLHGDGSPVGNSANEDEGAASDTVANANEDGWTSVDEEQSISSYAEARIFSPPQKEDDY